jgi:hypothetical protein
VLEKKFVLRIAVAWIVIAVAAVVARIVLLAAPVSTTEYAGWIFLAGGPLAIALIVARSAGSGTIAQVLYDAEHPAPREVR